MTEPRFSTGKNRRPDIDPRIRERRAAVRRRRARRRLHVVQGLLGMGALGLGAYGATRSPLLDVDVVSVTGTDRSQPASVVAAAKVRGRPLLDLDESAVAREVERLPWVLEARVRRQWPGTVTVHVVERVPVALVSGPSDQQRFLVDATGRILAPAGEATALPLLADVAPLGRPGDRLSPVFLPLLAVAEAVPVALVPGLAAVAPAPAGSGVELRLHPQGVARLGPAENVASKLGAVMAVLKQVDTTGVAVIDVRVPQSPVLTRRQPVTKVSTTTTA